MFKKIMTALLGINLMSIGLNIVLDINWGVGPFDSMTLLVQKIFNITNFSNASLLLHMFFAVILLLLIKVLNIQIRDLILSCLSIFVITRFVWFYGLIINISSNSLMLFISGFLILNLGLYFISISNILIAPYDKFIVEVAEYTQKDLGLIRLIGDVSLLTVVIVLNLLEVTDVVISVGTIFITIGTGLNITLYEKIFERLKLS